MIVHREVCIGDLYLAKPYYGHPDDEDPVVFLGHSQDEYLPRDSHVWCLTVSRGLCDCRNMMLLTVDA